MQTKQQFLIHNQMRESYPFSYAKGTIDWIGRILNNHNIRTIFKPSKKIEQILRNPKTQRPLLSSVGIYKIPCSCGQVHIGEIGRMINLRNIYMMSG